VECSALPSFYILETVPEISGSRPRPGCQATIEGRLRLRTSCPLSRRPDSHSYIELLASKRDALEIHDFIDTFTRALGRFVTFVPASQKLFEVTAVKSSLRFWFYTREFEDSGKIVEVAWHPELRLFGLENVVLKGAVEEGLSQRVNKRPARALQQFIFHEETALRVFPIKLPYKQRSLISAKELTIPFAVIVSRAKTRPNWRAYVPALNLSLFFRKGKEIDTELPKEILKALMRHDLIQNVRELSLRIAAESEQRLEPVELIEEIPSLKDYLRRQAKKQPHKTPELNKVCEDAAELLAKQSPALGCYQREPQVTRIVKLVSRNRPRSIVLVGPRGSGKTAIVFEVARRLAARRAPGARAALAPNSNQERATGRVMLSSGPQIVAGMSAMGDLEERCRKMIEETKREKIVVHASSLLDLLYAGRHQGSALGVAAYLKEAVARCDMILILEATADELLKGEEMDPGFTGLLERVDVDAPSQKEALRILEGVATDVCQGEMLALEKEALKCLLSLQERFEPYASLPGRSVRFLMDLVAENPVVKDVKRKRQAHQQKTVETLGPSAVTQSFSSQTGLPLWLLQDETRLVFDRVRDQLGHRVIGQSEAVSTVSQLVCRVKAGLAEKEKPLMSLLFVGPTGVGKTEMAKALAEFFFSNSERLLRFDMSEYSNSLAVARLTGTLGTGEGDLTKKLRETPFSVVLFDELEKADLSFFDLLLQILGEGRLTDAKGRMASFRHAIVIMTSNLGAASARRGDLGFAKRVDADKARYLAAVEDAFRPELLNRIDSVVPFDALSPDIIRLISEREIERILQRDGIMRNELNVVIGEEVKDWITALGFDEANGARPLKRALERQLVIPMAEAVGKRKSLLGRTVTVSVKDDALTMAVSALPVDDSEGAQTLSKTARIISASRRRLWQLEAGQKAMGLRNERFMLLRAKERAEARKRPRGGAPELFDGPKAARLQRIESWLESFAQCLKDTEELEELTVQTLLGAEREYETDFLGPLVNEQRTAVRGQLLSLMGFMGTQPNRAFMVLSGELPCLQSTLDIYQSIAEGYGFITTAFQRHDWTVDRYVRSERSPNSFRFVQVKRVSPKKKVEPAPEAGRLSVGLDIRGQHAAAIFHGESGAHLWKGAKTTELVELSILSGKPRDESNDWHPCLTDVRRMFDLRRGHILDSRSGASRPFTKMKMARVISSFIDEDLENRLLEELR
jgi:ATP-dependent Clp protease ATP-binding subunit ClpA